MSAALQPIVENKITSLGHSKRPRIRLAQFDDYEQIAAVEARHGLTVKSREQWLDLWLENPAYRELPAWPIGWVIENDRPVVTVNQWAGVQILNATDSQLRKRGPADHAQARSTPISCGSRQVEAMRRYWVSRSAASSTSPRPGADGPWMSPTGACR